MKKLFFLICFFLCNNIFASCQYPQFEQAFVLVSDSYITSLLKDTKWRLAYDIYNFSMSHLDRSSEPRIPKIIHHIWIGGELPQRCYKFIQSCKSIHPGWKFFHGQKKK